MKKCSRNLYNKINLQKKIFKDKKWQNICSGYVSHIFLVFRIKISHSYYFYMRFMRFPGIISASAVKYSEFLIDLIVRICMY